MVSFKLGLGGGVALLGLGAILIFREQIGSFFKTISGGVKTAENVSATTDILSENLLGNLTGLQDVLKGFQDFKFPEIKIDNPFANFDFGNFFKQNQGDQNPPIILDDRSNIPKELNCECGTVINQDINGVVTTFCTPCEEPNVNRFFVPPDEANMFPPAPALADNRRVDINQENFNVQTGLINDDQQFRGGGLSFIGGSVSEIPIERLSLGQIIERFNVTASQASDIRARALDDFGDFDFGTNTGSGIGNIPVIPNIGQTSGGFEGLTPEEIALRLTGGNISNF